MKRNLYLILGLLAFGTTVPGGANIIVDPPFERKMAAAELVVIGTATARQRGGRFDNTGSATFRVLHTLKGASAETLTVTTFSGVPEMVPQCCLVGATYILFLRPSRENGRLVSVGGPGGIVMVGGAPNSITVIPAREGR